MISEITAFNAGLAERQEVLNVRTYLRRLNVAVFKEPIDVFVDDLLDLVVQDTCCIPHDRLVKYGVLSDRNSSTHCERMMKQYELKESRDFAPTLVQSIGAGRPAVVFLLHPDAFETCLMRAKNTRVYTAFYILLRKSIAGYDKYLLALESRKAAWFAAQSNELKIQNDELKTMMRELGVQTGSVLGEIKESRAEIGNLQTQNGKILAGLSSVKQQTEIVAATANSTFAMLDAVTKRNAAGAADRAIPPEDIGKTEAIVLLKLNATEYMTLRIQSKLIASTIKRHRATYPRLAEVLRILEVPNATYLWTRIREALASRIKTASPAHNTFTLEPGVSEAEVISVMRSLHAEPATAAGRVGDRIKKWADTHQASVTEATGKISHTVSMVQTVTTTTTISLTDADFDELFG